VVGYEQIPAHPTDGRPRGWCRSPKTRRGAHELRHRMVEAGYQELINYFVSSTPPGEADFGWPGRAISVINPIAAPARGDAHDAACGPWYRFLKPQP